MKLGDRLTRILLTSCFALGVIAATASWYLLPKGFPVTHSRFWVNSVLPPAVAALCLLGIIVTVRKQDVALKCLVVGFGAMLVAAGITGNYLFPKSIFGVLSAVVWTFSAIALISVGLAFWFLRKSSVATLSSAAASLTAGVLWGILLLWSQRGADVTTKH